MKLLILHEKILYALHIFLLLLDNNLQLTTHGRATTEINIA